MSSASTKLQGAPGRRPGCHRQPGRSGPVRDVLRARVRAALVGSEGWEEFAERLRLSGVLVRERYSTRTPGEITGSAVALPAHGAGAGSRGQSVWFGGGKLAPDLTLPQLQARWTHPAAGDQEHASRKAGRAGSGSPPGGAPRRPRPCRCSSAAGCGRPRSTRSSTPTSRSGGPAAHSPVQPLEPHAAHAAAQAAAAAASEVLSAVSWLVEGKRGGPLRTAADSYDRAARNLRRRTVPATAHSRSVRTAAGGLLSTRLVKQHETRQLLALLSQLSALSDSLARLRESRVAAGVFDGGPPRR